MQRDIIHLMSELKNQLELERERRTEQEEMRELSIDDLASFGKILNEKRKMLGLDIQSLEWQTGISSSTLKRLFKDPSQVKFTSVLLVAKTLGIKLCFAK